MWRQDYLGPIQPHRISVTFYQIPLIEETLFGLYTRGNTRKNKELAAFCFQESIEESRKRLEPWMMRDYVRTAALCRADVQVQTGTLPEKTHPPNWSPKHIYIPASPSYSTWITVYLRVNCYVPRTAKLQRFIDAHLEVIRLLDSLDDPSDEFLADLPYYGMGQTQYPEDVNLIQTETRKFRVRPYPLELLRARYPEHSWTIEDRSVGEIMELCKALHTTEEDADVRDALWFYYGCFLDYLFNGAGGVKPPLDLYPFDNRCFTAYDLPSAFHILITLSTWEEGEEPPFALGKCLQKSLPFAGARRTLVTYTDKLMRGDPAFWKVFSSVFYCMLLDTYPEDLSKRDERPWDLDYLKAAKKMCSDKEILSEALARKGFGKDKETDKGCYIIFTAFRMWIMMMVRVNPHYKEAVAIDWTSFQEQTVTMARTIRRLVKFDSLDPFAEAREVLSKSSKNPDTKVYRYRKEGVIEMLSDKLFKDLKAQKDLQDSLLRKDIKERLLNSLLHVPKEEWLTPICLSMMRLAEFGSIKEASLQAVLELIDIYYGNIKPKDFEATLERIPQWDKIVIAWYFRVVCVLNKVSFRPLTLDQVVRTDHAMANTRYTLFPGQVIPDSAYDVYFTICCEQIKTLTGRDRFGHEKIAHDPQSQSWLCATHHKKNLALNIDELAFTEEKKTQKRTRKQLKDFAQIPCAGNPVFCVSLRGFMLVYGGTQFYVHCSGCACLHSGTPQPLCWDCSKKTPYQTCTVCGVEGATEMYPFDDPTSRDVPFQVLWYCKRHIGKARRE